MDGCAEKHRLHPHVCVFKLLTLASRRQAISKASSIQQAAGGCCRSALRTPGRRKSKDAAFWVLKQFNLHPSPISQFTHVGAEKQESNSFALNLEVVYSWNNSDKSSAGEKTAKLGHLCRFLKMKTAKTLWPGVKAHFHSLIPGS